MNRMNAYDKDRCLRNSICARFGIDFSINDANTLRRAELTLHRWAELECGDGCHLIERNDAGVPFMTRYNHSYADPRDPRATCRVADREAGALRRVAALCKAVGLHFYHQTDPRGCALYVHTEPLTDTNYSNGFAVTA